MSEQRIIVLTGASRGLGRAMARQFVDRGHTEHLFRQRRVRIPLARQLGVPRRPLSAQVDRAQ